MTRCGKCQENPATVLIEFRSFIKGQQVHYCEGCIDEAKEVAERMIRSLRSIRPTNPSEPR